MTQYIDSSLFDTFQTNTYTTYSVRTDKITTTKPGCKKQEIVYETCEFILNAPIFSGKSTMLMKHIKKGKDNNYIIVVLTTNIANDFYKVFDYKEDSIKLCIKDALKIV